MSINWPRPHLAQDLERIIFMEAAKESVYTASMLVLVAKRVQAWIEPILYRIIMLSEDYCWPPFKRLVHPAKHSTVLTLLEKHGRHVQHLLFCDTRDKECMSEGDLIKCLDFCPNVVDLALWSRIVGVDIMRAAGKMKLWKLSGLLDGFQHYAFSTDASLGGSKNGEPKDDSHHSDTKTVELGAWKDTLTHLELANSHIPSQEHLYSFLQNLTSLKYLSMNPRLKKWPQIKTTVLKECPSLRALAYVDPMPKLLEEDDIFVGWYGSEEESNISHLSAEFKLSGDPLTLESRLLSHPTVHVVRSLYSYKDPRILGMYSKYSEDWLKTAIAYDLGGGSAKDLWDTVDEVLERDEMDE